METLNTHKTGILNTRSIIKQTKEAVLSATMDQKKEALKLIFEARQLQHTQIQLAKKDYPNFNWHSLI